MISAVDEKKKDKSYELIEDWGVKADLDECAAFNYAYNGNATVKNVTFTASLKQFPSFSWCNQLESVNIPESVTEIDIYTFSNCSALLSITIPESVTVIGKDAVGKFKSLQSITIAKSVTITDSIAKGCPFFADA